MLGTGNRVGGQVSFELRVARGRLIFLTPPTAHEYSLSDLMHGTGTRVGGGEFCLRGARYRLISFDPP